MPLSLEPTRAKAKRLSAFQRAQKRLIEMHEQLIQLEDEREHLHHKEELLWQSLDQQESIVYHLGVMLAEHMDSDSVQTGTLAALLNDVRAHQLKRTVGSGPCSGLAAKQLYTSQMLCAAVTPEHVAAIKQADVEKELVPKLRDLTMRLAFLLSTSNQTMLSDSLNEKVDEYSGMVQLLHTAADCKLLALGLLNFDSLEYGTPPDGHWEQVCDAANLRPEQERTLATGFMWYAQRRSDLIAELEQYATQLQALLAPLHSQNPGQHAGVLGLGDPLSMETAEKLQGVLENLDRLNRAIREVDRYCVYLSINTMDKRQLAQIAVSSYPFLNQPPACCAVVAQRYKEKQKALQHQRATSGAGRTRDTTAAGPAADAAIGWATKPQTSAPAAASADAGYTADAGSLNPNPNVQQQSELGTPPQDHEQQQQPHQLAQQACETAVLTAAGNNPPQHSGIISTGAAFSMAEPAMWCGGDGAAAELLELQLPAEASIWLENQAELPDLDFARMF